MNYCDRKAVFAFPISSFNARATQRRYECVVQYTTPFTTQYSPMRRPLLTFKKKKRTLAYLKASRFQVGTTSVSQLMVAERIGRQARAKTAQIKE